MVKLRTKVISINISPKKGTKKKPVDSVKAIENFGLESDAHAKQNSLRQISLLSVSSINKIQKKNIEITFGDFGENITLDEINIYKMPIGSLLNFENGTVMMITQIGKKCHTGCEIYKKIGNCVMPIEGVFARVISSGIIHTNEVISISYE